MIVMIILRTEKLGFINNQSENLAKAKNGDI